MRKFGRGWYRYLIAPLFFKVRNQVLSKFNTQVFHIFEFYLVLTRHSVIYFWAEIVVLGVSNWLPRNEFRWLRFWDLLVFWIRTSSLNLTLLCWSFLTKTDLGRRRIFTLFETCIFGLKTGISQIFFMNFQNTLSLPESKIRNTLTVICLIWLLKIGIRIWRSLEIWEYFLICRRRG